MTAPTPVDRVAEILAGAGYRRVGTPLEIAGVRFEFPVAFVGASRSPDLVVVADTAFDQERRILQRVEGIARAMDVVQSRRPLTAVLTGPRPSPAVLEAMSRVCRVLPVGTVVDDNADTALRNWLAVLLPLSIPKPDTNIVDPLSAIKGRTEDLPQEITALVTLAPQGTDAVQSQLHKIIAEPLADVDSEDEQ
jgi:hypothetical protein